MQSPAFKGTNQPLYGMASMGALLSMGATLSMLNATVKTMTSAILVSVMVFGRFSMYAGILRLIYISCKSKSRLFDTDSANSDIFCA